ncbi:TetR/AcrR family transcriptional regulator [uncultured Imperialibacter sp.]|uniref:TetR/AcrR family transcriptional regulator n=1 Tax=uncultured Imperialibacter sp. TaxID=1672639 RepID=UPI0030DABE3E|tara:strand:- start:726 stop:1343 length:618 start_codon:yes stop_codon:yes gene_type:complete
MARDGKPTRDKILAESKTLVLENGFAGTSVDQILERSKITKGAFFYHFKSKADLARTLIEDFSSEDLADLDNALKETEALNGDPLQRLLKFIQRYIDMMATLESPYPGCLYASYIYEPSQFSDDIKEKISSSILTWRRELAVMLDETQKTHRMKIPTDKESLADQFTVILEGAFVVSKALNEPQLTAHQLKHYKNYLELLFEKRA